MDLTAHEPTAGEAKLGVAFGLPARLLSTRSTARSTARLTAKTPLHPRPAYFRLLFYSILMGRRTARL